MPTTEEHTQGRNTKLGIKVVWKNSPGTCKFHCILQRNDSRMRSEDNLRMIKMKKRKNSRNWGQVRH